MSQSPADTHALGVRLGALAHPGAVIALSGPLGAGKTLLATGIAQGLQVPATTVVNSPTYVLMNIYSGRCPIYHFDWYRLSQAAQLDGLDLEQYLHGEGVALIEWADRFPAAIPATAWHVRIKIVTTTVRHVDISGVAL